MAGGRPEAYADSVMRLLAYPCPSCSTTNGIDADAAEHNMLAGTELWGSCLSCGTELSGDRRSGVTGECRALLAQRTPVASNHVFRLASCWTGRW